MRGATTCQPGTTLRDRSGAQLEGAGQEGLGSTTCHPCGSLGRGSRLSPAGGAGRPLGPPRRQLPGRGPRHTAPAQPLWPKPGESPRRRRSLPPAAATVMPSAGGSCRVPLAPGWAPAWVAPRCPSPAVLLGRPAGRMLHRHAQVAIEKEWGRRRESGTRMWRSSRKRIRIRRRSTTRSKGKSGGG